MHEKEKLEEAKYFYHRMIEKKENISHFKYNLSAFLSSARSVLQYALKEAKTKEGGRMWYNNFVSNNPVLGFFKGKRNINIHTKPIQPQVERNIMIKETIHTSEAISIVVKDKDGNVIGEHNSSGEHETNSRQPESVVVSGTNYKFDDWNGSEDVLILSQIYIQKLEDLVKEGIQKRFIAG